MDFMVTTRPGPIVGVCIVWAAFTGYAYYTFLNADLSGLPAWFPAYYTGITITAATGIVGILLMRTWGLWVFITSVLIDQAMLVNQHQWHVMSLLLPMLVVMVVIAHLEEMR